MGAIFISNLNTKVRHAVIGPGEPRRLSVIYSKKSLKLLKKMHSVGASDTFTSSKLYKQDKIEMLTLGIIQHLKGGWYSSNSFW